jgi:hypothetical protein
MNKRHSDLWVNPNAVKKWMKLHFERNGHVFFKNKDDWKNLLSIPRIGNGHIAISALCDKLCQLVIGKSILRRSGNHPKSLDGLHIVTERDVMETIESDREMKTNLFHFLDTYDAKVSYNFVIDPSSLNSHVDSRFFAGVHLERPARNIIIWLLLKATIQVTNMAYILLEFAGKRTVDITTIKAAVKAYYIGEMRTELENHIDGICAKYPKTEDDAAPSEQPESVLKSDPENESKLVSFDQEPLSKSDACDPENESKLVPCDLTTDVCCAQFETARVVEQALVIENIAPSHIHTEIMKSQDSSEQITRSDLCVTSDKLAFDESCVCNTPVVSTVPVIPAIHDIPIVSDVSDVCNAPVVSTVPVIPAIHDIPVIPVVSDVSDVPIAPGTQDVQQTPIKRKGKKHSSPKKL